MWGSLLAGSSLRSGYKGARGQPRQHGPRSVHPVHQVPEMRHPCAPDFDMTSGSGNLDSPLHVVGNTDRSRPVCIQVSIFAAQTPP